MAEEKRADVLFVIDASDSMKPCFDQLRNSIKSFVKPFKEEGFTSLRLGLLAYNAGPSNGKWVYRNTFINGDAPENMNVLYGDDEDAQESLFTRSGDGFVDVETFCNRLDSVVCCADENTPLALDCAGDFPFEPICTTRRIIVLFTDEKLEDGVLKEEALGENCSTLEKVMDKIINQRHASLYYFGPHCEGSEMIEEFSRVIVNNVKDYSERSEGENVWADIDFERILEGMAKSISHSVLQVMDEGDYSKAVYGQDKWDLETWGKNEVGGVIDITNVKEGAVLDVSEPLTWINVQMLWKTPIDLDLHAFYRLKNGTTGHLYFRKMEADGLSLDRDAGRGDVLDSPSGNEENIRSVSLDIIDRILFATKIYSEHGCFSDYRGEINVTTSNPRQQTIHMDMVSRERLDWCVIAMLDNTNPQKPRVQAINQVVADDPNVNDSRWVNWQG